MIIETLDQLLQVADNQVTAQDVLNGNLYLKKVGWRNVTIHEDLRDKICEDISQMFGGRHKTRAQMLWTLKYDNIQHWGLGRIILSKYKDFPPRWKYIAGQDYTEESKLIRNALS